MVVALLRGENLRLYRSLEIRPHPRLNLIVGSNASGKTSLLEALFLAGRGRSFRAQTMAEIHGPEHPKWSVFVELAIAESTRRIGVGWSRDGMDIRLDEERSARIADVIRAMPLQLIDPGVHRLLEEGPTYRRSFVDWGVFHVEHRFLEVWRRYQRALKQRNGALRAALDDRAVQAWNDDIVEAAEQLTGMRRVHIAGTESGLRSWGERLLGTDQIHCEWMQGWPEGDSLRDVLDRNLDQHRRLGITVQGAHRAELKIRFKDQKAKGWVSRGQQKLLITAMVLAQAELLIRRGVVAPVLLLDDFTSELAPEIQERLIKGLAAYEGQKFVTAFEVPVGLAGADLGMFHVEHGTIRALSKLH